MSDEYITIIPEQPDFVPDTARQIQAISYFGSLVSQSPNIQRQVSNQIQFIDCGQYFKYVKCPSCDATIDTDTWLDWMKADFSGEGFSLNFHKMTCCQESFTLQRLKYHFPQGFARFQLSAINSNIGQLSDIQISQFEQILECSVRAIYRKY
jgi:hypothetical protein